MTYQKQRGGFAPYAYHPPVAPAYQYVQPIQQKKTSGAKMKTDKKGRPCISAWKSTKRAGLIRIVACPLNKYQTKNPKYDSWVAKVSTGFSSCSVSAIYNNEKKILMIPDLQMYITAQGGFVAYYKRKS